MLVSLHILVYPDYDKQFIVECDASNYAIGGVLSQLWEDNELHPVYFYSKKLSKAEINYSITEKELLAIKTAFVEWRHLLMGAKHKILVYNDHRNFLFVIKPQLYTLAKLAGKSSFHHIILKLFIDQGKLMEKLIFYLEEFLLNKLNWNLTRIVSVSQKY